MVVLRNCYETHDIDALEAILKDNTNKIMSDPYMKEFVAILVKIVRLSALTYYVRP